MEPVKRYTIKDIAEMASVSSTTVSRYINGQYQYMSEDTRERIRAIIEKCGYRPSLIARGLKQERSFLFGVVMPHIHNTLTASTVIRGICRACSSTPYNPIIASLEDDLENEPVRIRQLLDHRVDGIISFTGCQNPIYKQIRESGMPIIAVDRYYSRCGLDGLVIDHYNAVMNLLKYLIDNGYTRIVMLMREGVASPLSTVSIREKAFMDFHKQYFKHMPRLVYRLNGEMEQIKLVLLTLKAKYPKERLAIFVPEMNLLQTVDWALKLVGMHYPDDMALCGYTLKEDPVNEFTAITTVSQSLDSLSQKAFELLLEQMNGKQKSSPEKIIMTAELNIRSSTEVKKRNI